MYKFSCLNHKKINYYIQLTAAKNTKLNKNNVFTLNTYINNFLSGQNIKEAFRNQKDQRFVSKLTMNTVCIQKWYVM